MPRYVDIENCGALVEVLANTLEMCHFKHKAGCIAPDCRDCLHRHFNEFNSSHLIPTADVRPERHGHWIEEGDIQICSECGEEHSWQDYRASYCDCCGAKMDGERISDDED